MSLRAVGVRQRSVRMGRMPGEVISWRKQQPRILGFGKDRSKRLETPSHLGRSTGAKDLGRSGSSCEDVS